MRALTLIGMCAALAACSSQPETDVAAVEAAIVGGELSDDTDAQVVELYAGSGSMRDHCSASLIAPNVILTALHCVAEFNTSSRFSCSSSGALVATPPNGRIGLPKDPETIDIHVGITPDRQPAALGLKVFGSGAEHICQNDIALVVLDQDLDLPVASLRFDRRTRRGDTVRAVGYGSTGMSGLIQRRVRTGIEVTDVGPERDFPAEGLAPPNTFVVTEGPCQGDSGGPAIDEETGATIGVYSISGGTACTATGIRNTFTSVAPFQPLIMEALEFAGHEPVLEPPEPEPPGGAGGETSEPQGGTAGTAAGSAGTGGTSAGRAGAAQGGMEPEDPGSGSREDASCACRVMPSNANGGRAAWLTALAALALLRRRRHG